MMKLLWSSSADWALRYPITGILGCCVLAASGQPTAEPPTSYFPLLVILIYLLGVVAVIELSLGSFSWPRAMSHFMAGFFLVFSFFNALYNAMTGVYPGEVLPTEIRGLGTGFAAAFSRIGAALGTFLMPWSMANLGPGTTMLIAAGITALGAAVSQALAPETKGMNLSETSAGLAHGHTLALAE